MSVQAMNGHCGGPAQKSRAPGSPGERGGPVVEHGSRAQDADGTTSTRRESCGANPSRWSGNLSLPLRVGARPI
jgi:hypothetical protein